MSHRFGAQRAVETAARQRAMEDNVLEAANRLDPADERLEARQIRATAESIRDHRMAEDNMRARLLDNPRAVDVLDEMES